MSPEAPGRAFGRTRAAAARAAFLLALLGCGAVAGVERALTRSRTPLGDAFQATGIPPVLPLALGVGAVLFLAVTGYWKSVASAERFRLTPTGFEVSSPLLGEYALEWKNVREAGLTAGRSLGISVESRERVLETHRGTERQRELLRTMAPFGAWDFLYPRADLGHRAEEVLGWMEPFLGQRDRGIEG